MSIMKILVYEGSAGFSSYTHKLCNALCEVSDDIEITYVTAENNSEIRELDDRIRLLPVLKEYDRSSTNSVRWYINRTYISLRNIIVRNIICKKGNYDVVSIQFTIAIFDQFMINSVCKRVVYTAHDVIPPNKSKFWSFRSLNRIYKRVPQIIVHTEGNRQQLIESFGVSKDKISVIHHGLETKIRRIDQEDCLKKLGIQQKYDIILLFYGSIREQKGLDDLLNALRGIEGVHLIIAGAMPKGESFTVYEDLIRKNGLSVTKIIKYVPFEMTDILFQACDVVCLPYKYFYSQSGVFMQAIQYRRPVIASDVCSFGEYINKYHIGVLSKPGDWEDLHDRILEMRTVLKSNSKNYSDGLELAAAENSWNESAVKHLKLFKRHEGIDGKEQKSNNK